MQVIGSNNGTEYFSGKFNKFYEVLGIEHQLTAPYTPQQNGVVERENRTIMEMKNYLIHDKGLPKKFQVEVVTLQYFYSTGCQRKHCKKKKTPFEA